MKEEEYEDAFQFLAAYFNEDFVLDFDSPETAIRAFICENNAGTRMRVVSQLRNVLKNHDGQNLGQVLFSDLGCYYDPTKHRGITYREWLEEIITEIDKSLKRV